jgi:uncharacterized protein
MAATLERFSDHGRFVDRVGAFLGEREAEHNLLFGILDSLGRDPSAFAGPPYLAAVAAEDRVVAVALRTPPHNLVLSEVDDPSAIDLIVDDLVASGDSTPGALGPVRDVNRFAAGWSRRTGRPYRRVMSERIFRLTQVIVPPPVPGSMRTADLDDRDLLVGWLTAFSAEALPEEEAAIDDASDTVDRWLLHEAKRNYLWQVDGRPVSWTGVGGRTPHGTRIGPVYTPPAERGRGYARSLVAAASQAQLDAGLSFCFLFTDLANPTSNHVYQSIGYEAVSDVDVYTFG